MTDTDENAELENLPDLGLDLHDSAEELRRRVESRLGELVASGATPGELSEIHLTAEYLKSAGAMALETAGLITETTIAPKPEKAIEPEIDEELVLSLVKGFIERKSGGYTFTLGEI